MIARLAISLVVCRYIATPLLVNGHLAFNGHADALFSPSASSVLTMLLLGTGGLLLLSRRHAPSLETAHR